MTKVILQGIGIDVEVFEKIESERAIQKMPRATFINQKLKEYFNL